MNARLPGFLVAVTIGTLFLTAAWSFSQDAPANKARAEMKRLQGRWHVLSAVHNGSAYPTERVGKMLVVIADDELRLSIQGAKSEQAARFVLDPAKFPRHIDFIKQTRDTDWEGRLADKLFTCWKPDSKGEAVPAEHNAEGIYKLEGDKLTLCWRTTKGKDLLKTGASKDVNVRPRLFQSVLYYHQFLFVLERPLPRK